MQNGKTELKFLFGDEEMLKVDISEAVGFENRNKLFVGTILIKNGTISMKVGTIAVQ